MAYVYNERYCNTKMKKCDDFGLRNHFSQNKTIQLPYLIERARATKSSFSETWEVRTSKTAELEKKKLVEENLLTRPSAFSFSPLTKSFRVGVYPIV